MKKTGRLSVLFALAIVVSLFAVSAHAEAPVLMMATTTSTDNTGLLDYLAPILLEDEGIELQWVSVGTGAALQHGRDGNVDVVLTHDPEAEKSFVDEEFGVEPREIMYNDFVVIGPDADPAGIRGMAVNEAFAKIASESAPFASRADQSGTHMAELRIWRAGGVDEPDRETWYIQTGQGMLQTITLAGEREGYSLADRGTYITYEVNHGGNPPLVIVVEGDESLRNQYSVIPVNPAKHGSVNFELAKRFSDWLASPKVQQDIANFTMEGKQLFFPNAD